MEAIADETGRLDGLIAAAGINHETPALQYTSEDAERMMSINFTGAFMTAQAAARQMVRLKQKGSILMIASMSATIANRGMLSPYVKLHLLYRTRLIHFAAHTTLPKPQ